MLTTVVKYFFLGICSVFLFSRVACCACGKLKAALSLVPAVVAAGEAYLLNSFSAPIRLIVFIATLIVWNTLVFRCGLNRSIVGSVVSAGIAYCLNMLATVVMIPIGLLTGPLFGYSEAYGIVTAVLVGCIEIVIAVLMLRIKRLKNALPVFIEKGSGDIGVYICISVLLINSLFSKESDNAMPFIIPIFIAVIAAFSSFFWWRRRITRKYIEQVNEKERNLLKEELKGQSDEIELLNHHNESLSEIIHKDNKMIPALEMAVRDMLNDCIASGDISAREKASGLLSQITTLADERSGIISSYERKSATLPESGISSTDAMLKYMLRRSADFDTRFDVSFAEKISAITAEYISENDLNTILADIIENAFIAVWNCERRHVLLSVGKQDEKYVIELFDSGSEFDSCVINDLGIKRHTTRKKQGGSGIGLYNTYSLLRKNGGGLCIDETVDSPLYTKKLVITFGGDVDLVLKTHDIKKAALCAGRRDLKIINE